VKGTARRAKDTFSTPSQSDFLTHAIQELILFAPMVKILPLPFPGRKKYKIAFSSKFHDKKWRRGTLFLGPLRDGQGVVFMRKINLKLAQYS
jgi:hypothetical protein